MKRIVVAVALIVPWFAIAVVLAQVAAPPPAADADPAAVIDWIVHAARSGSGRFQIAAVLVAIIAAYRWGTRLFGKRWESIPWYRDRVLPIVPVVLGSLAVVAADLVVAREGASVWPSIWRGLSVGCLTGGAYKAFAPLVKLAIAKLWPSATAPTTPK